MFGDANHPSAHRLISEVQQLFHKLATRPPEPRPSRTLRDLKRIEQALTAREEDSEIPEHLWPELGAEDETEIKELAPNPALLLERTESAIAELQKSSDLQVDSKGGRVSDGRIDRLVWRLGDIYERYSGRYAGVTLVDGQTQGPFADFIEASFAAFWPGAQPHWGKIDKAMRRMARDRNEFGIECQPEDEPVEEWIKEALPRRAMRAAGPAERIANNRPTKLSALNPFWLTETQFSQLIFALNVAGRSRSRPSDRAIISGVIHVLLTGCSWAKAPPCFGNHKTLYRRFVRWEADGLWPVVFARLAETGGPPAPLLDEALQARTRRGTRAQTS